jgi:hypothetical protein
MTPCSVINNAGFECSDRTKIVIDIQLTYFANYRVQLIIHKSERRRCVIYIAFGAVVTSGNSYEESGLP